MGRKKAQRDQRDELLDRLDLKGLTQEEGNGAGRSCEAINWAAPPKAS